MKILFIVIICCLFATGTKAQTFSEWFFQNKTQKKYLIQQIAALQIYIGYAQKGYSIAKNGLDLIGDLKRGEFNLHAGYFSSLKSVNPKIRNYAKVADIILLQLKVISTGKNLLKAVKKSDIMNAEEMNYISRVFEKLLKDCALTTVELIDLVNNGKLEMTDDERITRIDDLYREMQLKSDFSKDFSSQTLAMVNLRLKSKNDADVSGELHGINN